MNPYVYSKRRKLAEAASQPPASEPSTAWSLVKEVVNAPIGTAMAFAFVLFAAGAVASMSLITYPDLAAAGDVGVQVAQFHPQQRVLGDSIVAASPIVDDASLEAAEPMGKMEIKPVSFNSNGRWNFKISYSAKNLSGTGSITIGTYIVASGITASGSIETGAILKPGMVYHVTFWNVDSAGAKIKLQSTELKTPKGKNKPEDCKRDATLCPKISEVKPPCTSTSGECSNMPKPCNREGKGSDESKLNQAPCGAPLPSCPTGQICPTRPTGTPPTMLSPREGKPVTTTPTQ